MNTGLPTSGPFRKWQATWNATDVDRSKESQVIRGVARCHSDLDASTVLEDNLKVSGSADDVIVGDEVATWEHERGPAAGLSVGSGSLLTGSVRSSVDLAKQLVAQEAVWYAKTQLVFEVPDPLHT